MRRLVKRRRRAQSRSRCVSQPEPTGSARSLAQSQRAIAGRGSGASAVERPHVGDHAGIASIRAPPGAQTVGAGQRGAADTHDPEIAEGRAHAAVHDQAELHLETAGKTVTTERFPGVNQYVLQVEAFGTSVRDGTPYACPLEFSKGTQRMIDMTYAAAADP